MEFDSLVHPNYMKAFISISLLLTSAISFSQEIKPDSTINNCRTVHTIAAVHLQNQYRGCCPPRRYFYNDQMSSNFSNYSRSQRRGFYKQEKSSQEIELGRRLVKPEKQALKERYLLD